MLRQLSWSLAAVVAFVTTAAAQKSPSAAGSWNGKTMVGPKDSVVATYVLTIAAEGKSATMKFPKHAPIPTRIVAMGGDSVVTEAGPYPSVLRPGQTVTSLHTVAHYKGNTMTGWFEAHYTNGDVVKGKIQATRRK
jgi:hypothetical protein